MAVCHSKKIYCELKREKVETKTKKCDSLKDILGQLKRKLRAVSLIMKLSAQNKRKEIKLTEKIYLRKGDGFLYN